MKQESATQYTIKLQLAEDNHNSLSTIIKAIDDGRTQVMEL